MVYGSPSWIRTNDPAVTSGLCVSAKLGLSHFRYQFIGSTELGVSPRYNIGITSFRNSLCTFPHRLTPMLYRNCGDLAQDYHNKYLVLGFPELTQFFNRDYARKLRYFGMNLTMTIGTQHCTFVQFVFYELLQLNTLFCRCNAFYLP